MFNQIFVKREYQCLDDVASADLIVDCGANVGFSSAYFLSRFPGATVIAVEPDAGNFAALEWNLQPFGERVRAIQSAVWSHPCGLVLEEQTMGARREWARQVRECRDGEAAAMTAMEIGGILDASGRERISILKIDVEGAEGEIFSRGFERWIGRVDNIVIEIHNEVNERIFRKAIEGLPFLISGHGELTVCKRTNWTGT